MDFLLLGPFEIVHEGRQVNVGGPTPRALLAVLAHRANTVIPANHLVEAVWGNPRDVSLDGLYHYISRLRRSLTCTSDVTLRTRRPGYELVVDNEAVDALRFEELVRQAASLRDREPQDAAERLRAALGLWRGKAALIDLDIPSVRAMAGELDERRLDAEEKLAQLELDLDRPGTALDLLRGQPGDHPTRLTRVALEARALHRTGRRNDALDLCRRTAAWERRTGLEPHPVLRQAHEEILRDTGAAGRRVSWPFQLPPDTPAFVGRDDNLAALIRLGSVEPAENAASHSPRVAVISGTGGMGKTALSIHAAHRLTEHFPDGVLFVDLLGFAAQVPPMEPTEALDRLLSALGTPREGVPTDLSGRSALLRTRLAGRQALLILDNARSVEQVRPLLPATAGCMVIITSRYRLTGLDDTTVLTLDPLTPKEGAALFGRIAGPDRVANEQATVEQVVELCGRLPLAIRIAAARLRSRPVWTVLTMANRLHSERGRLAELADGHRDVRACLALSYRQLEPAWQRMFRLLGLPPGPDVDVPAAAALAGVEAVEAEHLLEGLLDAHLLTQQRDGRYRFYDLVRIYAGELARDEMSSVDQHAAAHRVLTHYLRVVESAARTVTPYRRSVRVGGDADGLANRPVARTFVDQADAMAWLADHRPHLLSAVRCAHDNGLNSHAWRLADAMWGLFLHGRYYVDWLDLDPIAIRAARESGDSRAEAQLTNRLGYAYLGLGRFEDAEGQFTEALRLRDQCGDRKGTAGSLRGLGTVRLQQGRPEEALAMFTRALRIYQELDARRCVALARLGIGEALLCMDRTARATAHFDAARTVLAQHPDPYNRARAALFLGRARLRLGDLGQAGERLRDALAGMRAIGSMAGTADVLTVLGELADRSGDPDAAHRRYSEALELQAEMGAPAAAARTPFARILTAATSTPPPKQRHAT